MADGQKNLNVGFLFDDTLDSNDGVAQYVKTLGAWLSGQGHEVSYLVGQTRLSNWSGSKVYSLAHNIPVFFNGNNLSIPLPANRATIKSLLASRDFDILHVMMPHSPMMSQIVINQALPQTTVVGTFHIYPAGQLTIIGAKTLRFLYGRGLSRITQVVSVSPAAARFARQAFGLDTRVVPNMVDLKRFKTTTNKLAVNSSDIVFLGRLVPRKGVRELLEAFIALRACVPEARLIIAGDGPERPSLEKIVRKNNLGDSVKFLGYVKEAHKPKLLASARIACFPSLGGESFGIVLIEAMAAGAGVVLGGDNPGYQSVLGGQPELLVDARDAERLAQRLEMFLNDKDATSRMHSWQQKQVRQYDVEVVGRQILDVYRQAIAKHGPGGHN